jgi:hypothetical protein
VRGRAGQETHELALRKENQMKNLQNAFGIDDAVEGQAFDRELQEQKRLERIAAREARFKEKERQEKEEEKRRKKAAKEAKKAAKEAEMARNADRSLKKVSKMMIKCWLGRHQTCMSILSPSWRMHVLIIVF